MAQLETNRLVRKEVMLGVLRDPQLLNENHLGLTIAPFQEVASDDVIFDYTMGLQVGLAPARAEDAESELAQKDETVGTGRASIIDWALKDHYDPSDVTRFREAFLLGQTAGVESFPLTVRQATQGFQQRIARDAVIRRRKLDNRIEWLIMQALFTGGIDYNDGKVIFSVDYGRPTLQNAGGPPSGGASATAWTGSDCDPIDDTLDVVDYMRDTYGVRITRALCSSKILRNALNSDKFAARSGMTGATGGKPVDPRYLIDGWGYEAAIAVIERATGVRFIPYDGVYRTRAINSTTPANNRYSPEDKIVFLPDAADVAELDDAVGFAATLTSPHPEGNWQSGYYEWERETVDPWGQDMGTGIKAFPVFPHLDLSYVLKVIPS